MYNCKYCVFRSSHGIDFVKHLFEAHKFEDTFHYQCGISSCTRVFTGGTSFDAFRGHCTRKHHNWQHGFTPNLEPAVEHVVSAGRAITSIREVSEADSDTANDYESTQEDLASDLIGSNDTSIDTSTSGDIEHNAEQLSLPVQKQSVKTAAAKFILTLKEKYKLTQASLDYAVKAVDELISISNKAVQESFANGQGLTNTLYASPFDDLKTEYQQTKYFKENFGLIVSVDIVVPYHVLIFMYRSH